MPAGRAARDDRVVHGRGRRWLRRADHALRAAKATGITAEILGEDAHARELLGNAFELEFIRAVWMHAGESGEAIWQLLTTASPPFKALAEELDPSRRAELHAAWVEFYERHRTPDGIRVPHGYVVIIGRRRVG